MDEPQYVFSHTADASERERLRVREQLLDARSQRYLTALGLQLGWRCLEVGAGQGSIARWLAEQVGPQGWVVATDIMLRFLTEMHVPNVEVRQHDIRTDPLEPGRYHLAHCRAVLIHMPDPPWVVRRMVEALQLGGWLVIEEPDLSSLSAADATHPLAAAFDRQYREVCDRMARTQLADPYLGRHVRRLLEDVDLTAIESEGVSRIVRGGGVDARRNCLSLQAFMERGLLSQTEYTALQAAFLDPSFSFITETTFAAWGKRTS
jgi:ubiquinone/menaquinone biosynthesis C-methylase UbiE